MGDPAHKTHNREVAEATDRLLTKVIPELAKKILKEEPRSDGSCITLSVLDGSLITEIHKEGKSLTRVKSVILNAVVV
jgi:hypothetical protein